jgi:hypothetical protein
MGAELRLHLIENGADPQRLETLTGFLRDELLQLDVETVAVLPTGTPPAGARAIDATAVGGLLVSLGHTAGGLRSVVQVLQQWLARGHRAARTVRLEIDGDVLQLSNASAADQERLVELFIGRHATRDGPR